MFGRHALIGPMLGARTVPYINLAVNMLCTQLYQKNTLTQIDLRTKAAHSNSKTGLGITCNMVFMVMVK